MKRSPTTAFWLSLIPGAGHIYIGQTGKGVLLILILGSVIQMVDRGADGFGILIPFIWLFAMLDAHRSAQELNLIFDAGGEPTRHAEWGLSRWWGWILIGLGVLFALDNFNLIRFDWIWELWPLFLIGLGIYILKKRPGPEAGEPATAPPPAGVESGTRADHATESERARRPSTSDEEAASGVRSENG